MWFQYQNFCDKLFNELYSVSRFKTVTKLFYSLLFIKGALNETKKSDITCFSIYLAYSLFLVVIKLLKHRRYFSLGIIMVINQRGSYLGPGNFSYCVPIYWTFITCITGMKTFDKPKRSLGLRKEAFVFSKHRLKDNEQIHIIIIWSSWNIDNACRAENNLSLNNVMNFKNDHKEKCELVLQ